MFDSVLSTPNCILILGTFIAYTLSILGLFIGGLVTVNLPTLEKVFGISSTKLGLIVSSNDMAAVLFVSFVSFFGAKRCKPRWIGIGSIITGTF